MKKVIILGSSGELGNYLSLKLSKSYDIIAVNRNDSKNYIDFSDRESIIKFLKKTKDIFGLINCYGIQKPIQNFAESDFEKWEKNIYINFINYSFFLQNLINKNKSSLKKVISFSGGGATFPRKNFSAYSISKISLYKLNETLALEFEGKIDFNIIAPGVIKSKMIQEIVSHGQALGNEYKDALKTLSSGGQSKSKVLDICTLLLSDKSDGLTGRLIAAQWDNISLKNIHHIINDKNLFTLKRIDNKYFNEKE
tara:strand:- start:3314 stop:4072 length:759 start_codon:yes stop_codon:yes gene_type:complete